MKISLIADPHLNKTIYKGVMDEEYTDIPFRNADFMRAFEFIVNKNINEIHPDLIVILGDVYDTPNPFNPVRTFFNAQLRRLSEASIPTIILVGNHDVCSKHHALEPIGALGLKNVKVISSPKLISYRDNLLMMFPYSMEVEKKEIAIRDQFHNFIEESRKKINEDQKLQGKEILFFGHFGVNGAIKNTYDEDSEVFEELGIEPTKKQVVNHNASDVSISDLESIGASYVFLGDYHQHQVLTNRGTIAFYVGSPEKCNFAEKDHIKGFVVYDSESVVTSSLGKCAYIEYPNCRPMVELKGTYGDMLNKMAMLPSSERTLIKLNFIGNEKDLLEYSIKLPDFKKQLKAKFNPLYIYPKQKVINEEEEKQASQIEQDILSKGHIDNDDVRQVAEEGIKEKEKDPEEQIILIKMSNEIYEETMEEK